MKSPSNTMIESIGAYLPPNAVSTEEVLAGCKNPIRFPLEQLTGIRSRRMAGEDEFSIDLARKAIDDCLSYSNRAREEIDLLVCCNISRYDGSQSVTYEPGTAVQLRHDCGLTRALAFDVSNACAGMFTGIYLADALIKAGLVRCALLASGEYITHLTRTAQAECSDYMDPKLAGLTLGDAGAAAILTASNSPDAGFHALDMYTIAKYSPLCIAKPTDEAHGGAFVTVDSIALTAAGVERYGLHAAQVLMQAPIPFDEFRHFLPHQTSSTTIRESLAEISRLCGVDVADRTIDNLADRANTASNTHFVALKDRILDGTINSGDRLVFCISGSGLTLGTALYTFDDLPDRIRAAPSHVQRPASAAAEAKSPPAVVCRMEPPRIRVEAIGLVYPETASEGADTRQLAGRAGEACLAQSARKRSEIDVLIGVGLYRSDFIAEPAAATLVAADLKINHDSDPMDEDRTLEFDLVNGPVGFLNACYAASGLIKANDCDSVMIVAAEAEGNVQMGADGRRGLKEMASAVILDRSGDGQTGFRSFVFKDFPEHLDAFRAYASLETGGTRLVFEEAPDLEARYLECIADTVAALLSAERLDPSRLKVVFPPQLSSAFVSRLSERLQLDRDLFVDLAADGKDWYTSSVPGALLYARQNERVSPGDLGLLISVGAGIAVGCAIYQF